MEEQEPCHAPPAEEPPPSTVEVEESVKSEPPSEPSVQIIQHITFARNEVLMDRKPPAPSAEEELLLKAEPQSEPSVQILRHIMVVEKDVHRPRPPTSPPVAVEPEEVAPSTSQMPPAAEPAADLEEVVPDSRDPSQEGVQQQEQQEAEAVTADEPDRDAAGMEDSFDQTVAIVPRSQQLSRNNVRPTPFARLPDTIYLQMNEWHRYVMKYINVRGQVISVFRTHKGSLFIRFWDGYSHKFGQPPTSSFFHADDQMISHYESAPQDKFAGLPPQYWADIDVYGEYIDIANELKSGDMIAVTNLHLYRSKHNRNIVPTIHEGGQTHGRGLFLLEEEEREVVQMKTVLNDKLDYIRENPDASRMESIFNRPAAEVRPLPRATAQADTPSTSGQQNRQRTSPEVPKSAFRSAREVHEEGVSQRRPRPREDDDIQVMEQPRRRVALPEDGPDPLAPVTPAARRRGVEQPRRRAPVILDEDRMDTDDAGPAPAPSRQSDRARRAPNVAERSRMEEEEQRRLPRRSQTAAAAAAPAASQEVDLAAFFRLRFPSPLRDVVVVDQPPAAQQPNNSIFDFFARRTATDSASCQTTPVKMRSNHVQCKPKMKNVATQMTPMKSVHVQMEQQGTEEQAVQTSPAKNAATSPIKTSRRENDTRSAQTSPTKRSIATSPTKNKTEARSTTATSPVSTRETRQSTKREPLSVKRSPKKEPVLTRAVIPLRSPSPPHPPPRWSSLTEGSRVRRTPSSPRGTKRHLDQPPPVPDHAKRRRTRSSARPPVIDPIELKPILRSPRAVKNNPSTSGHSTSVDVGSSAVARITAVQKFAQSREEEEQKPVVSPARLRIRPSRVNSSVGVATRRSSTRLSAVGNNSTMNSTKYDPAVEEKPVINDKFLEKSAPVSTVNVTSRRQTSGISSRTSSHRRAKSIKKEPKGEH